ncbi:hypothetical protein [Sagittula sp. MA-2]|jgi:uncharacterized protein Yka (UPF0111/DUF47 family)|uniref:hypothetical protein n=1 Tax=Sagittula sp. MA-2 TaxID=3048007 RepID=UPI0024C26B57|nr:hypothetical protein [Sagittula sp. MA-2]WHZ33399.1 hypothetical protein QNI11_12115 [Sagittula sp. MA-2]
MTGWRAWALAGVVIAGLIAALMLSVERRTRAEIEKDAATGRIENIEGAKELRDETDDLETDPDALRRELRDRLHPRRFDQ